MSELRAADASTAAFDRLLQKTHAIGKEVLAAHAAAVDRDARFPAEAIDALRQARLLSACVPREQGGMGLNIVQVSRLCETLGQYCGSTAMIFAMHKIQVACIVHHARQSSWFRAYLGRLVEEQRLIASATTEVGVGGDLRTSLCAVEVADDAFRLIKKAPVISYGEAAHDILVTCRKSPNSPPGEQVHVLVQRGDFAAEPISGWDTMGFRGTCSCGFTLTAHGKAEQILPEPFADILAQTMHPYSHIVWSALWSGIAADAVNRARAFVRSEARKTPGETPPSALRLAEVDGVLQQMRHNIAAFAREYQELLLRGEPEAFSNFGFSIRTNNLKVSSSQQVVDIVGRALLICGIAGYRNDSKFSLSRHLRDAYGAALMVNNDRILKLNATMLLAHREG
jgi:acyl-CoA dehydrogenase